MRSTLRVWSVPILLGWIQVCWVQTSWVMAGGSVNRPAIQVRVIVDSIEMVTNQQICPKSETPTPVCEATLAVCLLNGIPEGNRYLPDNCQKMDITVPSPKNNDHSIYKLLSSRVLHHGSSKMLITATSADGLSEVPPFFVYVYGDVDKTGGFFAGTSTLASQATINLTSGARQCFGAKRVVDGILDDNEERLGKSSSVEVHWPGVIEFSPHNQSYCSHQQYVGGERFCTLQLNAALVNLTVIPDPVSAEVVPTMRTVLQASSLKAVWTRAVIFSTVGVVVTAAIALVVRYERRRRAGQRHHAHNQLHDNGTRPRQSLLCCCLVSDKPPAAPTSSGTTTSRRQHRANAGRLSVVEFEHSSSIEAQVPMQSWPGEGSTADLLHEGEGEDTTDVMVMCSRNYQHNGSHQSGRKRNTLRMSPVKPLSASASDTYTDTEVIQAAREAGRQSRCRVTRPPPAREQPTLLPGGCTSDNDFRYIALSPESLDESDVYASSGDSTHPSALRYHHVGGTFSDDAGVAMNAGNRALAMYTSAVEEPELLGSDNAVLIPSSGHVQGYTTPSSSHVQGCTTHSYPHKDLVDIAEEDDLEDDDHDGDYDETQSLLGQSLLRAPSHLRKHRPARSWSGQGAAVSSSGNPSKHRAAVTGSAAQPSLRPPGVNRRSAPITQDSRIELLARAMESGKARLACRTERDVDRSH